jgi:hypothetical protein
MKYFFTTAAAFTSTSAFAHDGLHMHPHGAETFLGLAFIATVVIGAVWAIARNRS